MLKKFAYVFSVLSLLSMDAFAGNVCLNQSSKSDCEAKEGCMWVAERSACKPNCSKATTEKQCTQMWMGCNWSKRTSVCRG